MSEGCISQNHLRQFAGTIRHFQELVCGGSHARILQWFGSRWRLFALPTIYLLTPWCRVLLEKLTGLQLVKKFPAFHGTRRFITALTSVLHLSLSWARPIQSIYPHPTSWRSILILSTHLRLGLPSGLFPSGFPTKTLYTPSPHNIIITITTTIIMLTAIGCSPDGSGYFTCIQNMKLVTNKLKSGGLHEKHVVATWNLGNRLSICL